MTLDTKTSISKKQGTSLVKTKKPLRDFARRNSKHHRAESCTTKFCMMKHKSSRKVTLSDEILRDEILNFVAQLSRSMFLQK